MKLIIKASGRHGRQSTRDSNRSNGSPKKAKRTFATLETATLARVLRILERSVKAGEDLDPFNTTTSDMVRVTAKVEASPKKSSKSKKPTKSEARRSKSATPHQADDAEESNSTDSPHEVTDADLDMLSRVLELARDSLLATDCCLTLLSSDRLQKQVRRSCILAPVFLNKVCSSTPRSSSRHACPWSRTSSRRSYTLSWRHLLKASINFLLCFSMSYKSRLPTLKVDVSCLKFSTPSLRLYRELTI